MALNSLSFKNSERLVRINSIVSGHGMRDLEVILKSPTLPDGIVLPKVETPEDLLYVSACMDEAERRQKEQADASDPSTDQGGMVLIALIESMRGLHNLPNIVNPLPPRLRALIFGSDDYAADIGAIRTPSNHEMRYARDVVLFHAKLAGLQAIDLVYTGVAKKQQEGEAAVDHSLMLERECAEGFQMG